MPVRSIEDVIVQLEECGCCVANIRAILKVKCQRDEARQKLAALAGPVPLDELQVLVSLGKLRRSQEEKGKVQK